MSMPDLTRERLLAAIEPRSDQINYEDMIAGPRDVEVAGVSAGTKEQPVQIRLAGEARYYRPCKTMTRLLVALWGDDGRAWVGRRLRLVGDPNVMFGGVRVGGIRISHASHIDTAHTVALSVARGKRAPHTVQPLVTRPEPDAAPPLAAAPGKATAPGTPRQDGVRDTPVPGGGGARTAEPSSPAAPKTPSVAPSDGQTGRESTPETAAAPGPLSVVDADGVVVAEASDPNDWAHRLHGLVAEAPDDRVEAIWQANAERCRALYRRHKNDRTATANLTAIADYCKNIIDGVKRAKYGEVL